MQSSFVLRIKRVFWISLYSLIGGGLSWAVVTVFSTDYIESTNIKGVLAASLAWYCGLKFNREKIYRDLEIDKSEGE